MKCFTSKRRGAGGVFFITSCTLAIIMMITLTNMSRISTIKAISDNLAHVVTTKSAIYSYNNGIDTMNASGTSTIAGSGNYSPVSDFNKMAKEYGIMSGSVTNSRMRWNKNTKTFELELGNFRSINNNIIRPEPQTAIIETE